MKDTLLSCGNLSIDVERHQVLDGERQVELTYKEFEMLRYLMENQSNPSLHPSVSIEVRRISPAPSS